MDDSIRQDGLVISIPSLFSYLDRLYNIFLIFLYVVGLQRKDFDLYCYCNLNKFYWAMVVPTTADYQVADMH
jgi:hypothetical protein